MNEHRFDGKGKVYANFRPAYPEEFINYLYASVGLTVHSAVADIGAGTGILTGQLLQKGSRVIAVEPNDDMRKIAENQLHKFTNFTCVKATAENTGLPAGSVDFITVAQAFHWFDPEAFRKECRRILKPGGKVILVWNNRDETAALIKANKAINQKYCKNFKGFSGGLKQNGENDSVSKFFGGKMETRVFQNPLYFDEQSFIGRNLSSSYAPKETDEVFNDYVRELKALFAEYSENGLLTMSNFTESYVGTL